MVVLCLQRALYSSNIVVLAVGKFDVIFTVALMLWCIVQGGGCHVWYYLHKNVVWWKFRRLLTFCARS